MSLFDCCVTAFIALFVAGIIGLSLDRSQRHRDAICARRFTAAHSASDSLAILRDTLDDCRPAFDRAVRRAPSAETP